MRLEILREHQEIRRPGIGVGEPVWIKVYVVAGRVQGIKFEQRLVVRICRVYCHFRFDPSHWPDHQLVDANALDARRRVFDVLIVHRVQGETVVPPVIRHTEGQLGLRVVGIAPIDQVCGQLEPPQAQIGRETAVVADQVAENALRQGIGIPAHAHRHHARVLAQQAQAEGLRVYGQSQRRQPAAERVGPVPGQHRVDLFRERVVVIEAKTGHLRLFQQGAVRIEEAMAVISAETVRDRQRTPAEGRGGADIRRQLQLVFCSVVPVAQFAKFVCQLVAGGGVECQIVVAPVVFGHEVPARPIRRVFLRLVDAL